MRKILALILLALSGVLAAQTSNSFATTNHVNTFSAAQNLNAGGNLGGTFTGSPTFSGSPALSNGGSLGGTFTGSPTFSGTPIFADHYDKGPTVNVKAFGAKGDGVTDDTAAIQSAIDYAQTKAIGSGNSIGVPTCYLPAGNYIISAAITPKTCFWRGDSMKTTRITWNGTAGATVLTKDGTFAGSCSYGGFEKMEFRAGTARPATWLQCNTIVDVGFRLSEVAFNTSSGDAVVLNAGWVNAHWDHLRFDGCGGFCINARVSSGQAGATFSLKSFTMDSNTATPFNDYKGFFQFDSTAASSSDAGTVSISDGRIENNNNKMLQGIINVKGDAVNASPIEFHISDITYADGAGSTATSSLLYIDRNGTYTPRLMLQNVRFVNALGSIFNGSTGWQYWNTAAPILNTPVSGMIDLWTLQSTSDAVQVWSGEGVSAVGFDNTSFAYRARFRTDTSYRFEVMADGKHWWGNGTSIDASTNLYRSTSNTLKTDAAFIVGTSLTVGASGTAINNIITASGTLTFTAIAAVTCQEQPLTVTNASTTNFGVAASPRATLGNVNLAWSAWVSASGTVSVRVCNPTAASITPNAVAWGVTIHQ